MAKRWNVMVYQAGDNNLSEEMLWALKDMVSVGSDPNFRKKARVIVQFDPRGNKPLRYDSDKSVNGASSLLGGAFTSLDGLLIENNILEKLPKESVRKAGLRCIAKQMDQSSETSGPLGSSPQSYSTSLSYTRDRIIEQMNIALKKDNSDYKKICKEIKQQLNALRKKLKEENAENGMPLGAFQPNGTEPSGGEIDLDDVFRNLRLRRLTKRALDILEGKQESVDYSEFVEENSAAPEMVEQFIGEHIGEFKKGRCMVVLSGHGGGAMGDFLVDDGSLTSISIPSLGTTLKEICDQSGRKIDILGMDTCLMSMAEVCYQLKDSVEYLVGSEGFMMNSGWPYDRVLWTAASSHAPEALARAIVKRYIEYYRDYEVSGISTDLAACKVGAIVPLAEKVQDLVKVLNTSLDRILNNEETTQDKSILDSIVLAHWEAQSYKYEQYVDLWDFCNCLEERLEDRCNSALCKKVVHLCKKIRRIICGGLIKPRSSSKTKTNQLVLKCCHTGAAFQHSHGISIYFPWSKKYSKNDLLVYKKLAFADKTKWNDFLIKYLDATQRQRRFEGKGTKKELLCYDRVRSGVDTLSGKVYPEWGTKVYPEWGTMVYPEWGTKVYPEWGTKVYPEWGTKYSAKRGQRGIMKNEPDGFYPDKCSDDECYSK
jgi:hypothetical protein